MNTSAGCCGGAPFELLEPTQQAEVLATLAHEARLLQFSLERADAASRRIGELLQRALEQAMDADDDDAALGAREAIESALAGARHAGMRLSAKLDEALVEGAIGTMKMPVLTTVLGPLRETRGT